MILTGIAPTIGINLFGHGYNYRTTVAPWFRSLFTGSPDVQAIAHAPFIYQLHATAAWMIWALWPFSRLVHAWSYPLWYLWRPYIVYRSRRPAPPSEPGTAGANGARSVPRTKRAEPPGADHSGERARPSGLFGFHDHHARTGPVVAAGLVSWRRRPWPGLPLGACAFHGTTASEAAASPASTSSSPSSPAEPTPPASSQSTRLT